MQNKTAKGEELHPVHREMLDDIIEHPECSTRRLILADWLEEDGDVGYAERIRMMVLEDHRFHLDEIVIRNNLNQTKVFSEVKMECPMTGIWRRGFMEEIRDISQSDFIENAGLLFLNSPVIRVEPFTLDDASMMAWNAPLWKDFVSDACVCYGREEARKLRGEVQPSATEEMLSQRLKQAFAEEAAKKGELP